MNYKLLLCDIDDTLTETLSGKPFKQNPTDIKIISGADKAIAKFHADGWFIVGVSNQAGIAKGYKTLNDTVAEMIHTLVLFPQITLIQFCPDFEGNKCYAASHAGCCDLGVQCLDLIGTYRKPGSGMLHLTKRALEARTNKVTDMVMVGDRPEDEAAATGIGAKFYDAATWRYVHGQGEVKKKL